MLNLHLPRTNSKPGKYRSVWVIRKSHVRPWLINTGKLSNCYVTDSSGKIKQYKTNKAAKYDCECLLPYVSPDCDLIVTEWRIPVRTSVR